MRHPTEGVLRRLLDEPAGVSGAEREHVADCATCLSELAELRQDADLVNSALATESGADLDLVDVDAAWQRLSAATAGGTKPAADEALRTHARLAGGANAGKRPGKRSGAFLRRPVVAVVAAAVILTGAGTAAANGWLEIFSTKQVSAVSISTSDLNALPDLSAYGDLEIKGNPDVRSVPSAEVAAKETGLDVPEVAALPRGVVGEPIYQVGRKVSATFTFSTERAAAAAAAAGQTLPPPPSGVDGSQVRLDAGPGVAQIWTSSAGAPALIVGRAVAPKAFSTGVDFETLRDYLLSLPGLPENVATQLRTFEADGSTLPLPVPAEYVTTSTTEVDGAAATLLEARNGLMSGVIWVEDGVVTVVAGALDNDEILSVARGLR